MTTELQFLIDLLLNHKLSKNTKDLIAQRIKDVENNLPKAILPTQQVSSTTPFVRPIRDPHAQAASTQAILSKDPSEPPSIENPIITAPLPPPPSMPVGQRIVGGEVNTGRGSRGPRKF